MRRNRGAVLIVVLGVLAVLALLATTFATLQATEKRVARNYLDTVRAKLLAQSGIQDAATRLRDHVPSRYFERTAAGLEAPQPWKFWGADPSEKIEPSSKDRLEEARNPSFAVEDETPQDPGDAKVAPKAVAIDGVPRGVSGVVGSGTYAVHGDHYALKVSDLSGRLYVNDGVDAGPEGSVSQNLKRILNVLGDIVEVPGLGDKILAVRPVGGYRNAQDLLRAVDQDESLFARFKDFVTVYAWVDPNVASPVPLSAAMADQYPVKYPRGNPPVYRLGTSRDAAGKQIIPAAGLQTCPTACAVTPHDHGAIRIYGLDCLNPQWIEVVSRAPINVNAASREVLAALLADLRGFFVASRRRNNPNWMGDYYSYFIGQSSFSPAGQEGDEYGYLMETMPIVGPGGTGTGISAFAIADELIACRNRGITKRFNYASVAWGGPFRTWRQFYQFVDNLVTIGVIEDTRPYHFDFNPGSNEKTGFGALVASKAQKDYASRAIADAIKANFNPNLHLNEVNPDQNLFLIVDKTDLIVNSTEFCFLPTGYFEIESLGRVVRPREGFTDAYLSPDNELVAQAKVIATVRLYEMYRETNQRQFYGGDLPARTGAFQTNNDKSLEVGPEPDNGIFPGNLGAPGTSDNEWGGYVALPTVGGFHHGADANLKKPKGTLWTTTGNTKNEPEFNDAFHVHYSLDFDAHHHLLDRQEIAARTLADETVANYPDMPGGAGLAYAGPYDPTKGDPNAHRLARSYRPAPAGGGTTADPALTPFAPSDLRIDGGYSERHAAPAYYTSMSKGNLWNFSKDNARGMVSFWWKPSFAPELTGRQRTIWDLGRWHGCYRNPKVAMFPFALWFFPVGTDSAMAETNAPVYYSGITTRWHHPASLTFGSLQWHDSTSGPIHWHSSQSPAGHSFGNCTTSLNHIGHADEALKPSPLQAHRWMHTTFSWNLTGSFDWSGQASKVWVNGTTLTTPYNNTTIRGEPAFYDRMWYWEKHDGGEFNHMRLGAPSKIAEAAVEAGPQGFAGSFAGNYPADSTFDELYVWKAEQDADPLALWLRGRYYKPLDSKFGEGVFTSQAISFSPTVARQLPPASTSAGSFGSTGAGGATVSTPVPQVKILGVAWTWFGEGIDPETQQPMLHDYNSPLAIAPPDVRPKVALGVQDGSMKFGPFEDDAFSSVRATNGANPVLQDPKQFKYFAQFRLEGANLSTILLTTPVLDDVTVYWENGGPVLLSYVFDGRSF